MKLRLSVKTYKIDGKDYHRIHFKTKIARALGLERGDTLVIDVLKIERPEMKAIELRETTLIEAPA